MQREKRAPLDGPQSAGWWAEFLPVLSPRCHSWCPSVPSPRLQPELGSLRHLSQLASSGRVRLRWPKELTEQSERLALGCQASGFQGQGPREDCFPEEGVCGSRRNIQIPFSPWSLGQVSPPHHRSSFMRSWVCSLTPPSPPPRLLDGEKSSHLRFPKFCQREPLEASFGVLLTCPSFFKPVLTFWQSKCTRPGCTCSSLVLGSAISPKHPVPFSEGSIKTQDLDVVRAHCYGGVPAPELSQWRS